MSRSGVFSVYIMANFSREVFYTGMTNDLERRVWEHKQGSGSGFTSKYKCFYLVYYEDYHDVHNAIAREKQLKKWHHQWKVELIRKINLDMDDLSKNWY